MAEGFVYVLINPALSGLVKIGCTSSSAEERAAQLSASTGVPQPFVVAYSAAVPDMAEAERRVHRILEARGRRLTPSREFFQATSTEAIDALLDVVETLRNDVMSTSDDLTKLSTKVDEAADFLEAARAAWTGDGDSFRDLKEAVRLYQLAIDLGSQE